MLVASQGQQQSQKSNKYGGKSYLVLAFSTFPSCVTLTAQVKHEAWFGLGCHVT